MKIALKYGLLAGTVIAFWDMLNYFYLYKTFLGKFSFLIDLAILVLCLFYGMKSIKKNMYDGLITFGNSSLSGVQIALVTSTVLSLLTLTYYLIGNPDFEQFYISENIRVMQENKMTDIGKRIHELKLTFKPINQARSSFIVTLLLGAVFSFLFGMVFRNKLPESSLNPLNN